MNGRTIVYLPCDVVTVQVQLAHGKGLSPMEDVVLRAVDAGHNGFDALRSLLGLNQRIAIDLVFDLWRHDYLTLDFANGTITVTPTVTEHIKNGELEKLPGAERKTETRNVLVEKLTGHVLPDGGERRVPDLKLAVPAQFAGVTVDDVPEPDLTAALTEAVQNEHQDSGDLGRRPRVVSVRLPSPEHRATGRDRWLPLEIQVSHDEDSDRLKVLVVDRRLPFDRRNLAGKRLTQLLTDNPQCELAHYLRGRTTPELVDPPPLEEYLARFEQRAAKAADAPAGTRHRYHADLTNEAGGLIEQLRWRIRSEIDVELVTGTDEHKAALLEIIENADRQIVLACPRITFEGLQPLLEPLREALSQGKQVAIIWGGQGKELEDRVRNALTELRQRKDGRDNLRTIWAFRSSRTNAMLAIADDRCALVTGTEFMQRLPKDDTRQIGVVLRAPYANRPCEPIEHLLRVCRDALPTYSLGQALDVRFSDFHTMADGDATHDGTGDVVLPPLPLEPKDRAGDELVDAAARAWAHSWTSWAATLRQLIAERSRPWAQVVEDSEHETLLHDAIHQARHRLVIGSRRIGPDVVTPELVAALRQRLTAGASVLVAYQNSLNPGNPLQDPAEPLLTLSHEWRDDQIVIRRERTSTRLLVTDNEVVVGGFDFLSLEGYSTRSQRGRHRWRSETGIRIVGAMAANAVCEALDNRAASTLPVELAKAPLPPPPATGISSALLNELVGVSGLKAIAEVIHRVLATEKNPGRLVDDMAQANPGDELVRIAAAYLVMCSGQRNGPSRNQWLKWLILDRWNAGAFMEAAMLRPMLDDPDWRPHVSLSAVAAAHRTPLCSQAVTDALSDDLPPEKRAALLTVSSIDLLLGTGGPPNEESRQMDELDGILDLLNDGAEPWNQLCSAAREHWQRTRMPLSLEQVAADDERARHLDNMAESWSRLRERLDRATQTHFGFGLGKKTHGYLFHADGAFGHLSRIVDQRDTPGLTAWLAAYENMGATSLVDQAISEVASRPGTIHGSQRRQYVTRLEAIFGAAQEIRRVATSATLARGSGPTDGIRPVANALSSAWDGLTRATNEAPEPERILLQRALSALEKVAHWSGS